MFLQVCPVCEHRNPRGSRFCNECGSPLQLRFCPACHAAEDAASLVCRSCGEQLPALSLESPLPGAADVLPDTESIWKADAPPPGLHLAPDDGIVVTVHGGADATPRLDALQGEIAELTPVPEPDPPVLSERIAESKPQAEPDAQSSVPKTRQPTVIERLHGTQPGLDLPLAQTIAPPPAAEGVQPNVELTAESESEIEISAEAETLVEASVAPVTYQRPDEISVAEAVPIDEMAGQLRGGAWRSAIPTEGDAATRLTPALIQAPARPERRLSMHRIGLVVAAVGALAALVYSVRLSPGTGSPPAPIDASAPPPAVVPAPRAADVAAPAASVAAMPDPGAARSVDASPPAPLPATARGDSRENAPSAPPASIARTEAQAPVAATPVPAPRPAPAPAATREATAPPVMRARRPTVETPRTCTPAIAALGLCTLESNPEGK